MSLNALGIGSVVFLTLYSILFFGLLVGYVTKQLKLKSRWSLITLHVMIRLASQGVGLGFAIKGYSAIGLLVGYLILGAEGYFSLVLCTARFLVSWHNHNLLAHDSWLEPRRRPGDGPWYRRLGKRFSLAHMKEQPLAIVHWQLIAANAIIITGGNLLGGGSDNAATSWYDNPNLTTAKIMRAVGQAVFLVINMALFGCIIYTVRQARREDPTRPWYGHQTLLLLLCTWPFLLIRGVFGICQSTIDSLNYYYPEIYTDDGLAPEFVAKELVLATATEWISCALLMLTYFTSRNDPKVPPIEDKNLVRGDAESELKEIGRRESA